MSAGWIPAEGFEGESLPGLPFAFGGFPAISGISCLVDASPRLRLHLPLASSSVHDLVLLFPFL